MPIVRELTWDKHAKRWKKHYKGRQRYFPVASKLKTDYAGYKKCLAKWKQLKAEIDADGIDDPILNASRIEWNNHIEILKEGLNRLEQNDSFHNRDAWYKTKSALIATVRKMEEGVIHPGARHGDVVRREELTVGDSIRFTFEQQQKLSGTTKARPNYTADQTPPGTPPWDVMGEAENYGQLDSTTVAGCVEQYMSEKRLAVEQKKMSAGRCEKLRCCLQDFVKQVGKNRPIEDVSSQLLHDYCQRLKKQVQHGECSSYYAKDRLQAVKQFVKKCYYLRLIDDPRILSDPDFCIPLEKKRIEVFTQEEMKILLEAAPASTQLHFLLMLNCGMQQNDIAELRHEEVDWKTGRITRKRSKTKKHENVPTVSYKLWKSTFCLLKEFRSKHSDLVLVNQNGNPLKSELIDENGKYKKSDNIRNAYNRLQLKLKIKKADQKALKHFRKTAASKLGEHREFVRYAQYFLGHSAKTVADQHYVKPDEKRFDKAVKWLGKELEIDSVAR